MGQENCGRAHLEPRLSSRSRDSCKVSRRSPSSVDMSMDVRLFKSRGNRLGALHIAEITSSRGGDLSAETCIELPNQSPEFNRAIRSAERPIVD